MKWNFRSSSRRRTNKVESDPERIRDSIVKELVDGEMALTDKRMDEASYIQEGMDVKYFNRVLNTAVYDSLINSGMFLQLDTTFQQELADLYIRVKARNDLVYKIQHLRPVTDVGIIGKPNAEDAVLIHNLEEKKDIMLYEKDIINRIGHLLIEMGYRKKK